MLMIVINRNEIRMLISFRPLFILCADERFSKWKGNCVLLEHTNSQKMKRSLEGLAYSYKYAECISKSADK